MKFYAKLVLCGITAVAGSGLWGLRASWAQQGTVEVINRRVDPPDSERLGIATEARRLSGGELVQGIREVAEGLRAADGEDAKAKASAELAKVLDQFFDEDMKRRADELAKIEERVKKLRAQLDKRAAKKREIIDLQIKLLENEADGLGFFNNPGQHDPTGPSNDARLGLERGYGRGEGGYGGGYGGRGGYGEGGRGMGEMRGSYGPSMSAPGMSRAIPPLNMKLFAPAAEESADPSAESANDDLKPQFPELPKRSEDDTRRDEGR